MRVLLFSLLGLAAAASAAPSCQPDAEAALRSLNALRAQPQTCGARLWPAAPPLQWQATLGESAKRYATELAARDRLSHVSASGATLRTRLREVGYLMRKSGENLAGGPETLEEAMGLWLVSPEHCENLMQPDFQEVGLACETGPGQLQRYWVVQLAAPMARRAAAP